MVEKNILKLNGFIGVLVIGLLALGGGYLLATNTIDAVTIGGYILISMAVVLSTGFTIVLPNQARVFTFFGTYVGVIRTQGFWMTIPLTVKMPVSLRFINFNSERLKVNDLDGNPIEIAAVIVYKVQDSAKAYFDVENYEEFVQIQSETAIRHIASQYAYDNVEEGEMSLRKNSEEIAELLVNELQHRLRVAGVDILEGRIMHLAYAQEIASAMLQRQQAQAILSARQVIVSGAVGMVKSAIDQLAEEGVVEFDEEKKAQMVNNLMVAIVSDKGTQPIINTGTIY